MLAVKPPLLQPTAQNPATGRPKQEKEELLYEILPVIDHLEAALESATSFRYQELRQDVKIALHQLERILRRQEIEPSDDVGATVDPLLHEVVGEQCDPSKPENTVLAVRKCGYRRGVEAFRPAKVIVNVLAQPAVGDGS